MQEKLEKKNPSDTNQSLGRVVKSIEHAYLMAHK